MPEAILTEIFGTSVPAGTELEGEIGVPVLPAFRQRAILGRISEVTASTSSERIYMSNSDHQRIPYDGVIKGVQIRAHTNNLDLSGSGVDLFEVLVADGASPNNAKTIRGRSENVDKSRLVANGNYFYLKFNNPITAKAGDQMMLRLGASGSNSAITRMSVLQHQPLENDNDLATTAGSAVITSASGKFVIGNGFLAGRFIGIYGGGNSANYGYYEIQSVDSATQITLTETLPQTASNHLWLGTGIEPTAGLQYLFAADTSGDGPLSLTTTTGVFQVGNLEIVPIMERAPYVAVSGDSISAGSNGSNEFGSIYSWTNSPPYNRVPQNDVGNLIDKMNDFVGCTIASAGRQLDDWSIQEAADRVWSATGTTSDESENYLSLRPSIMIHSTIANDCLTTWDESTYHGFLDDLKTELDVIGCKLILSTGTPLPGRNSTQRAKASELRGFIRSWAVINSVRVIESELAMRDTTEDTLASEYDNGDGVHLTTSGYTLLAGLYAAAVSNELEDAFNNIRVDGYPIVGVLAGMAATLMGESTANGNTFKAIDGSRDRVTSSVDNNKNRTSVVKDLR